jgi:hypothetical protein
VAERASHKRVDIGGEKYLPFAEKKLRQIMKLDTPNISQKYVAENFIIYVKKVSGVGYVNIIRMPSAVYSGVVRGGTMAWDSVLGIWNTSYFMPTYDCWSGPLNSDKTKWPLKFRIEPKLSIQLDTSLPGYAAPGPGTDSTQYRFVTGSMYSGKMRKVVQSLLGTMTVSGSAHTDQLKYNYMWNCCHGIITGEDDVLWLVEISAANGILLMELPYIDSLKKKEPKITAALGGVPSGGTFPTAAALTTAISEGRVIQLKTAADMATYFSMWPYSPSMGWSFKEDGSEAHNTCLDMSGTDYPRGKHYMLKFKVGKKKNANERAAVLSGPPVVVDATATLTLVSSGPFFESDNVPGATGTAVKVTPFVFSVGVEGVTSVAYPSYSFSSARFESKCTIFVCHLDDVLEKVYWEYHEKTFTPTPYYISYQGCATSDRHPIGATIGGFDNTSGGAVAGTGGDRPEYSCGLWSHGTRDAYIFFDPPWNTATFTPGTGWRDHKMERTLDYYVEVSNDCVPSGFMRKYARDLDFGYAPDSYTNYLTSAGIFDFGFSANTYLYHSCLGPSRQVILGSDRIYGNYSTDGSSATLAVLSGWPSSANLLWAGSMNASKQTDPTKTYATDPATGTLYSSETVWPEDLTHPFMPNIPTILRNTPHSFIGYI